MKAIFLVFSNPIGEDRLDEYLEWYATDHMPKVLQTEGFVNAAIYRTSKVRVASNETLAKYEFVTVYEVDSDDPDRTFALQMEASRSGSYGPRDNYPLAADRMSCGYALVRVAEPLPTTKLGKPYFYYHRSPDNTNRSVSGSL